jgi:hypothetical protein
LPPAQVWLPVQACPQDPQLSASLSRFAHWPPEHCVNPAGQLLVQMLLLQICVDGQGFVQLPQWLLSEGTHALLQKSNPAAH